MRKTIMPFFCLLMLLSLLSREVQAGTFYVKAVGTGGGNAWNTAMGSVQAAINAAASGDSVFVAGGTYNLTTDITLKEGVQLLGGFAGTENTANQRVRIDRDGNGIIEPWEYANLTALQGNRTSRILTQSTAFSTPTLIDGFVISQGKGVDGGGANLKGGAILQGCIVSNNEATASGGGVYLSGATMQGCLVAHNTYATNGGGVYASSSSSVSGCKIVENKTPFGSTVKVGDLYGGGVVYRVEGNTAQVMSLTKSDAMAWSGAGTWCSAYSGGGQTGWTLPTVAQLQQIYVVSSLLNEVLRITPNAQPFGASSYWSDTASGDNAEIVFFDTGYAGSLAKTNASSSVRAVRSVTF